MRTKIIGTAERPRLAVFRSNQHIYAQVIAHDSGHILAAASDLKLKSRKKGQALSREVGKLIATKAKAKGITKVVFDRAGYKFHGNVKALAEGAREGGLSF